MESAHWRLRTSDAHLTTRQTIAIAAALAAAYFIAAKIGLRFAFVHASATAVWPPTGIALAALLLLGYRAWPGIFLGAFFANVTTAGTIATSLGIATGNTLEGLTGAYLINRFAQGRASFARAQDVFRFVLLGAGLSTTVSATIGVTSLSLGGVASWANFGPIWLTWWLGDAAGALVVAPFLLLWSQDRRIRWTRGQWLEALLLLLVVLVVSGLVFGGFFSLEYLTVPLLIWAAFRLGPRETSTVIVLLSALAIWGTLQARGPFHVESQNTSLLLLQAFMALMALVSLPVAAVVAERKRAEEQLRESREHFRGLYYQERDTVEVLQRSLLPGRFPSMPDLRMAGRYLPAQPEAIGGDWYDTLSLPGGEVGLVIGDVAGRGIHAATVMAKVRNALRAYAVEGHTPAELAARLNRMMERGEMATLLYLRLDPATWKAQYVSAGHPPPLVVDPDRRSRYLEGSSLPLGTTLEPDYREHTAQLSAGSLLVMYTDGLIEQRGRSWDAGLAGLQHVVGAAPSADVDTMVDEIMRGALNGHPPTDDIALLLVQLLPLDARHLLLSVPAVPASLAEIRRALRRWLVAAGAGREEMFAILVATGEASANAIEHAYGLREATIEISAEVEGGQVTILVRDWGTWRPAQIKASRGRGLQVMRGLMDQVEVETTAEGTTVRLSRRLRPEDRA